uniref:Putative secreted protein n=1 Tax=Anopheles marajoara TaxID=58244 RepID=A0A2M4CE58_9DIPT
MMAMLLLCCCAGTGPGAGCSLARSNMNNGTVNYAAELCVLICWASQQIGRALLVDVVLCVTVPYTSLLWMV